MISKEVVIRIENLTKTFNKKEVIYNCNLNVYKGSIYGLLGANGAGKTTIFKILTGLNQADIGRVEILGLDIKNNRDELLKNIGSIIETPIFYEHLSARENLNMHLEYMNYDKGDVDGALKLVGLQGVNDGPVEKFSLGMRQRLGIARAIIHNPKILILDEPLNGLDPMGIRDMREVFKKLATEKGMTIVISSHILSEIEQVSDWVGVLVNGEIKEEVLLTEIKKKFKNGLEEYFFDVIEGGRI